MDKQETLTVGEYHTLYIIALRFAVNETHTINDVLNVQDVDRRVPAFFLNKANIKANLIDLEKHGYVEWVKPEKSFKLTLRGLKKSQSVYHPMTQRHNISRHHKEIDLNGTNKHA